MRNPLRRASDGDGAFFPVDILPFQCAYLAQTHACIQAEQDGQVILLQRFLAQHFLFRATEHALFSLFGKLDFDFAARIFCGQPLLLGAAQSSS